MDLTNLEIGGGPSGGEHLTQVIDLTPKTLTLLRNKMLAKKEVSE